MTRITVTLPDELAQRAQSAGLLSDLAIQQLLESAIRRDAGQRLLRLADTLRSSASAQPAMSDAEVVAEVKAVRAERRRREG